MNKVTLYRIHNTASIYDLGPMEGYSQQPYRGPDRDGYDEGPEIWLLPAGYHLSSTPFDEQAIFADGDDAAIADPIGIVATHYHGGPAIFAGAKWHRLAASAMLTTASTGATK